MKYFVFNGKQTLDFSSYEHLVNWLSQYNSISLKENSFLNLVGNNPNDKVNTLFAYTLGTITELNFKYEAFRIYRIYDENKNSIYDAKLKRDVLSWTLNHKMLSEWKKAHTKIIKYTSIHWPYDLPDWYAHHFRKEPFPCTGRNRFKHKKSIRTSNEHRQIEACEMPELIRAKRNKVNLPTTWETGVRDWRNRGWKSQSKNRHQWESRIKHNTAGIYECKRVDKKELAYSNMEIGENISNYELDAS